MKVRSGFFETFRILFATFYVAGFLAHASWGQETVFKTRLNGVDLWFDQQTGALVRLSSPSTGVVLEAGSDKSGLIDLAYPIDEFSPLRLASRFSKAQIIPHDQGLSIVYQSLGASRQNFHLPKGGVRAEVSVRAAEDGRSIVFSCRLENHSQAPVPQILFPDLWGLTPSNGVEGTELRFARGVERPFTVPFHISSHTDPNALPYYNMRGWKRYTANFGYYSENALRWLDFGGLDGGLSVFQREWQTGNKPEIFTYRAERDPMHLRLAWQIPGHIDPGQTWESGEFWFTPHPGGWAKGIEVFRDYVQQVNPSRDSPVHIRNGLGFRTIWMIQYSEADTEKADFHYLDLPRVAQESIKYGLDELVPWTWDRHFPEFLVQASPLLGTEQELLQGIDKAKALGVNVAPFISVHIILNNYVSRYGVKPDIADNWTYHPDFIPQFQPYYAHDFSATWVDDDNPLWQKDVQTTLTKWIDKGMYSIDWDQFGYKEKTGEMPALVKLFSQIRTEARSHDPQSTFSGESITDLEWDSSILDYTWNWTEYEDAGPAVSVLRWPRLNCNVDDSPLMAKKCFAEGLYLNVIPSKADSPDATAMISEKPELGAALKDLAALRKQFLPYFVDGHALGESILSKETTAFVRAYALPDRLLVFVLNDRLEPQQVVFRSDLSLWLPKAGRYQVGEFDQQGRLVGSRHEEGSQWLAVTRPLQPGEISALEVRIE